MWDKAVDNFSHALRFFTLPEGSEMCNKAPSTYPFAVQFAPEC